MGFLCINKEDKKNVSQEDLINQEFLRDIGLNGVYNVNPEINFCQEIFLSPEYYVTGATKLYSGLTAMVTGCTTGTTGSTIAEGFYNLDYIDDINLTFIFTGDTGYTVYNGSFCLKVFPKDKFQPSIATGGLNTTEIISSCYPFSAITANTLTKTFYKGDLPVNWGEYLIRPYYTFVSKECNPGIIFDSWTDSVQLNNFQLDTDYYLMTVKNPPSPILNGPQSDALTDFALITDKLFVNGVSTVRGKQSINGELNYFILSTTPLGNDIILILNGVQLTRDHDYNIIIQGFDQPPMVEIKNNIIKPTDWLLATYIAGRPSATFTDFGSFFMDTIMVSGFTSTTTPNYRTSGDNTLNYNPVTFNYEFFTSLPIDPNYSVVLTVNGVKLAENYQFFKSTTFDGRLIFDKNNTNLKIGDIISVLAYSKATEYNGVYNYGSLSKNEFLVQWVAPTTFTNDTVTGRFIIKLYDDDTGNLTNQTFVDFQPTISNYSALLSNLPLNVNFKFKLIFETTYNGYLNNQVITCSYAEGYFDTTNQYINNTY